MPENSRRRVKRLETVGKTKHDPTKSKRPALAKKYSASKHPLLAYEAAKQGAGCNEIASICGISRGTYTTWREQHEEFDAAIVEGYEQYEAEGTLQSYVYNRLPDVLRDLWDQLNEIDDNDLTPRRKIMALLDSQPVKVKQHLFLYAMTTCAFSMSEACNKVGVTYRQLEVWRSDRDFQALLHEIQFHKKNFFESALVRAVERGETAAIIFANKTLNRDRGYRTDEIKVKVEEEFTLTQPKEGNSTIPEEVLLGMSVKTRRELLNSIRRYKEDQEANTIEGEVVSTN